jgi:ribosomal protein S18 acetylase RimI-like enzyme
MSAVVLHDKDQIATVLRQNVYLNLYSLGDLDDFFWNYTTWYAWREGAELQAIILLYSGLDLPVLLAHSSTKGQEGYKPRASSQLDEALGTPLQKLLRALLPYLPRRFYTHLDPGLEVVLASDYQLDSHGEHYKMALTNPASLAEVDVSATISLSSSDLFDILSLYERSYPGNWFDPRMLETGHYFGLRHGGQLASIAGVHVYSPTYRVASLGNITTDPAYRGHGFGRAVTSRLGQSLLKTVDHVGLNVKADNQAAIHLYQQLGFEIVASYGEYMATSTGSSTNAPFTS